MKALLRELRAFLLDPWGIDALFSSHLSLVRLACAEVEARRLNMEQSRFWRDRMVA